MADLCQLSDVKSWLKLTATTDDVLLAAMITGASTFIQQWISRTIAVTAYTEKRDGHNGYFMLTRNYPVVSVSSIIVDNVAVPLATDCTQSGYMFDGIAIYLQHGFRFNRGLQNVVISYSAGYPTVPADIAMCCWELVGKKYRERDRIGQSSKTLGAETVAFTPSDLTRETMNMLRSYNMVVPI